MPVVIKSTLSIQFKRGIERLVLLPSVLNYIAHRQSGESKSIIAIVAALFFSDCFHALLLTSPSNGLDVEYMLATDIQLVEGIE